MRLLTSWFGMLGYFLMRNDLVWRFMAPDEREAILKANLLHNTSRPDYAAPELYAAGKNFDSPGDRQEGYQGRSLSRFLTLFAPESVLEIGPGSGYLTRLVYDSPHLSRYIAADINQAFLDFLRNRMERADGRAAPLSLAFRQDDELPSMDEKVDAILLFSSVHHIPDRLALFTRLSKMLKPGGRILATDPSHYWPRLLSLFRSMRRHGYLTPAYRNNLANLSTHHFCTLGEYRRICRMIPELEIEEARFFHQPKMIQKIFGVMRRLGFDMSDAREKSLLARWTSSEMAIVLRRR